MRVVTGKPLTARQRRRIARAVETAERCCGLQMCVYLGPTDDNPRAYAERLLAESGAVDRPAVLVLVTPQRRHFEIVTSPAARSRVSDDACAIAGVSMSASFAVGDVTGGIAEGVRLIAQYAGAGVESGEELPDVLGA